MSAIICGAITVAHGAVAARERTSGSARLH